MDLDENEVSKSKEIDGKAVIEEQTEETRTDREGKETENEVEKDKNKSEEMEEDAEETTKNASDDKVEEDIDGLKEEEENQEPSKERDLKKSPRTKSSAGQNNNKKVPVEKEKEPKTPKEKKTTEPKTSADCKEKETKTSVDKKEESKTPAGSINNRPVREQKSVERLVAVIEKDSAREFRIEKGRGTALKDIPNGDAYLGEAEKFF